MKLSPVSLAVFSLLAGLASQTAAEEVRRSYIVQLLDKPAASYTGEVTGLPATKPAQGQRLDVSAADVQSYISYLENKQASVLGAVAAAPVTHQYKVVFNGFAAMLTDDEVRTLKKTTGVLNITADSIMQLDTSYTPRFLGLDKAGGLWDQVGGKGHAGEDMIIGVVDGGVWPENPGYADHVDANGVPSHSGSTLVYGAPPANWQGICQTGPGFTAANCNNKLIGARFYPPTAALHWTEFASARDSVGGATGHGGHGTHTSTTAAGNSNVDAITDGVNLGKVSGMAPRARIAAYKVCWTDAVSGENGCPTSSSVAAIEQATEDGVNVITFSIGPNAGGGSFSEATEVAFLGAASAGIFVSAAAGNSGPTAAAPAPVSHISPWLTTVGNSTHNRLYTGTVTLASGTKAVGASSNANTPSAPLILAKDAGLAGIAPTDVNLLRCFGGADGVAAYLDPLKVAGKVLVCDRGNNVLVNKSANAKTAGAAGVVIANVAGGATTVLNQAHTLSTVHVRQADGDAIKAYVAATASPAAALGDLLAVVDPTIAAPVMNGSSSRGPNVANANLLKPDLTAPGTDILAGTTADLTEAQRNAIAAGGTAPSMRWDFYTGTSMATPHVAGIALLLKQEHPTWSPAAIKSALMTSASDTLPDGLNGAMAWDNTARDTGTLPWAQGAGHIVPNSAADPGLVYDASEIDYARFLCGINAGVYTVATCQAIGTVAAYNLNLPSIGAANVLGSLTVTRTVTNVGDSRASYTASTAMTGYSAVVTPATLVLNPGDKASFTVKLTRTTAPLDTWAYGSLTWSDGVHKVRSPIVARGSALAVSSSVYSEAASGSKALTIGTGFTGPMSVAKTGLTAGLVDTRVIGQANNSTSTATCRNGGGVGVNVHSFVVPANTPIVRFALYDDETAGGADSDLDLVVVNAAGTVVGSSGNEGSNEMVTLANLAAGTYRVCVVGYAPLGGQAEYALSSWVMAPGTDAGNLKVTTPGFSYVGGTGTVGISWSGLQAGKRYLGNINYLVGGVKQGSTYVEVFTNDPLPLFQNSRGKALLAE